MTAIDWKKWRHVTKLDPDKKITKEDIAVIVDSGTDAVMISGTQNITKENVANMAGMLAEYRIPKVLEPSVSAVIRDDVDFIFVPSIFNTKYSKFAVGYHKEFVQNYPASVLDKVIPEAYIVLNPLSAVALVTRSQTGISPKEAAAYGELADRFFKFPIVYLEYSGTYGNPELVKAVREKLANSVLYYGGGIDSREKAETMAKYANTIVVGNAVYKKGGIEKLKETIVK
ncbi:phosphoglycerol geranylgeranyltransferase [Methanocella sp. MCL-LM]|uniref:phosphoglycerol geranylgeranyltransferase n=1 Tax=Methanocella sp. MCL-LM TaxID=3412035 RepID=UPI003C73D4BC